MKAQYFQAIEKTFLECTGRGLTISDADRTHIESWFDAGIPLTIVQSAVVESCAGRTAKVRTISLAKKRVEKDFSAWKSRQVGGDRAVKSTYAERFDELLREMEQLASHTDEANLSHGLDKAVFKLTAIRSQCDDAATLQAALDEEERQLYQFLWDCLAPDDNASIESQVQEIITDDELFSHDAPIRMRIRNKKLRQHFSLPIFEVNQSGIAP